MTRKNGFAIVYVLLIGAILSLFAVFSLDRTENFSSEEFDRINACKNYHELERAIYYLTSDEVFLGRVSVFINSKLKLSKYVVCLSDECNNFDDNVEEFHFNTSYSLEDMKCGYKPSTELECLKKKKAFLSTRMVFNEGFKKTRLRVNIKNKKGNGFVSISSFYTFINKAFYDEKNPVAGYVARTPPEYDSIDDFMTSAIYGMDSMYELLEESHDDYTNIRKIECIRRARGYDVHKFLGKECGISDFSNPVFGDRVFLNTAETSDDTDIYLKRDLSESKYFYGIITSNGDLHIEEDLIFRGIILLNGGKLIIAPGKQFVIQGLFYSLREQNGISDENFIAKASLEDVITFGHYFPNFLKLEPEAVRTLEAEY